MKLRSKLIISFTAVILLMGLSVFFILQATLGKSFGDYVEKANTGYMRNVKGFLEDYYQENHSFEGLQEILSGGVPANNGHGSSRKGMGHGKMMGGMGMMNNHMSRYEVIVFDHNGVIIADSKGDKIGDSAAGLKGPKESIVVDGQVIGTVLFYEYRPGEIESEYLRSAKMAILFSTLLAAALAVFISIWLAGSITRPLQKLMRGIKELGKGKQAAKIQISGKDEFQELSQAFNEMSARLARNEEIRRTLVADVAHELRTPLTILQGKFESILEGAAEPSEQVILELSDEGYRLNRLVKDLQQLSLAEAGKLPLQKCPVNMKTFAAKVCTNLQWLAEDKGITLSSENIPEDVELFIDPDRMTQVLVNLIGNALRHTPAGGRVDVSAEVRNDCFLLHIADTGPGIPEESLPYIFERFYKRDPARTRKDGGTGLGLSIAKGFVEAHGGTVAVKSKLNQGTTFTVSLPKN